MEYNEFGLSEESGIIKIDIKDKMKFITANWKIPRLRILLNTTVGFLRYDFHTTRSKGLFTQDKPNPW